MNTTSKKVLKTVLIVFLTSTVPSFASQAEAFNQTPSLENFLFKYFEIPPIFKNLPKNVQHLIVRHWAERYIVPFVVQNPYARYDCAKKIHPEALLSPENSEFDTVWWLSFSGDDSEVAIGARHVHIFDAKKQLLDVPMREVTKMFCRTNIEAILPLDFSRHMTIKDGPLNEEGMYDEKLLGVVGPSLEIFHITGPLAGTKEYAYCKNILQDESIAKPLPEIMLQGHMQQLTGNLVRGVGVSPTGELVIPTAHKYVYILKDDGSVKKLAAPCPPFNPYDTEPNDRSKTRKSGQRSPAIGWYAPVFAQAAPVIALHSEGGITLCNYDQGTFIHIKERSEYKESYIKCLSPHAEWVLVRTAPDNILEIIDTRNNSAQKIVVPGGLDGWEKSLCFSPDGLFLILSNRVGHVFLYHAPTCLIIGLIDHGVALTPDQNMHLDPCENMDISSCNAFNHAGSAFITSVRISTPQTEATAHLISLWNVNPHWKKLDSLYKCHITLEQALFLIFLHQKSLNKKTLDDIAQENNLSKESLVAYLKRVRDSFTLDQAALTWYLRFVLLQERPVKVVHDNRSN